MTTPTTAKPMAARKEGQIKRGATALNLPVYALLLVYVIVIVYPLFWMLISSFKSNSEIYSNPFGLPSRWMVQNYAQAWDRGISAYFLNSTIVTVISTTLVVVIAAAAAYGMVQMSTRAANVVLVVAMGGLVLAPQVALIPLYRLLDMMNLLNTHWALIFPYVAFRIPMAILLIRSVFIGIPRELVDAATIDGCGSLRVLRNVYFPLSKAVLVTVSVLTAYFAWNEFLFAIVYVDSDAVRTIPAGLMAFRDALQTEWGVLLAGMVIAALPIIVTFVFLQRYFVAGVAAGGVKG